MFPIYEEQRNKLADKVRADLTRIADEAACNVKNTTERHLKSNAYLTKVTEDYIKLGYNSTASNMRWASCGEFQRASSYLKRLAKDMQRPYVQLVHNGPERYLGQYTPALWMSEAELSFPNTIELAPLYAHLELVTLDGFARLPEIGDGVSYVVRHQDVKSRRVYTFCVYALNQEACTEHPLITHFVQQAASDPVYRQLLKIP